MIHIIRANENEKNGKKKNYLETTVSQLRVLFVEDTKYLRDMGVCSLTNSKES